MQNKELRNTDKFSVLNYFSVLKTKIFCARIKNTARDELEDL
jgi:hypothetical protein